MKKILLVLVFLIIPQICFAADPMLEKFQELRYRLEAGTTFRDYNTAYQDVYIQYRKTNDEKYKELMELYTDFRDVWNNYIQNEERKSMYHDKFIKKYNQCKDIRGGWDYIDITTKCMLKIAPEYEAGRN